MSNLSEKIENILDKVKVTKPRSSDDNVDTYILPLCTLNIQFSDREFVCLTIAEHFGDFRYSPTSADSGFLGIRTGYRSFGKLLDEVFLQGVNLSTPYRGGEKLLRFADAEDGRTPTLEDNVRFHSLLEYVSREL
jgi:hypothetical protein